MANESLLANVDLSSIPDTPKPQSLLAGVDLSTIPDAPKAQPTGTLTGEAHQTGSIPDLWQDHAVIPPAEAQPFFTMPKMPQAPPELWRENASALQQAVWNYNKPPTMIGPNQEHELRPDLSIATGIQQNLEAGLRKGVNWVVANVLSLPAALTPESARKSQEATGFGQAFPTRADIFNSTFDAMNRALHVDNLAPPQDFADSLARGLGESGGPLAETVALSALTAGVINPLTTGIAQKIPYLYSWLFPVAHDAITFGTQSALEPDATIGSTGVGAGAGSALGFLGPCGRIARALGAAGIGLAQEYMSNPNAGPMGYARNAALMGAFAAIGAAHGITPDEAAAYTILDWAKGKYSDEAVARSLKMQGIGPLANEFAEDVTRPQTPTATSPSLDQLVAKFKPVTPEEFITERDKSQRRPFLTPYTAEEMKDWQHFLTEDNVGFALTPNKDIVGVFNNSGRKGPGEEAITLAIAKGGKTLDCVEGFLSRYYNSFGFVETKKEPWDESKAPEGWDYETYGKRPIVYFEFPEDFSRDPVDTRRRLELARSEGGPWRTGVLWDHDRWVARLAQFHGEGLDNQAPQGLGAGTEHGSQPLEQSASSQELPEKKP